MKKIVNWINRYYLAIVLIAILLLGIYNIFLRIDNNKLKEQNTQLKEKVAKVTEERDSNWDLVIERNNEIWRLEMVAYEWQQLFYAEIDFHPYEGYPYMDYDFSTSCK